MSAHGDEVHVYAVFAFITREKAQEMVDKSFYIGHVITTEDCPGLDEAHLAAIRRDSLGEDEEQS